MSRALLCLCLAIPAQAEVPLSKRIDQLVRAKNPTLPVSTRTSDADFVRRIYLDLVGRIPTANEARDFFKNPNRDKLIDQLLKSSEYAIRMQELFDVMLMERRGDNEAWTTFLRESFQKNKPWDQMVREMLGTEEGGATYFLSKRLDKYGQNPVDYPGLARDLGRLFLGRDLQCAQCHDHLFIEDYKQVDFQGLFAFIRNVGINRQSKMPAVTEKPTTKKVTFSSVFKPGEKETGPKLPGQSEVVIPKLKRDEIYLVKPDRKKRTAGVPRFSTLKTLAKILPSPENESFARNIVNRLWFVLMGRGLVHPLDLDHKANPPSHPKLLSMLSKEFVRHKFDIKWMIRTLVQTETYQRSTILPKGQKKQKPETFLTALERRLSAEQLLRSMIQATGHKLEEKQRATLRKSFLQAYANPAREPEIDFTPSLRSALFVLNDSTIQDWLKPKTGNLTQRLSKLSEEKIINEAYLSILSRFPSEEEKSALLAHLKSKDRAKAIEQLVWALLASTEFALNH